MTPDYDQSPLERRVAKMSAGEAKRVLMDTLNQWAAVDQEVREVAEEVLPERWLERDEQGSPTIGDIVKRLVREVKEVRG